MLLDAIAMRIPAVSKKWRYKHWREGAGISVTNHPLIILISQMLDTNHSLEVVA